MAIEVFNRYEKKYIIDEDTFHKLTYQIADYMNPDAYNRNGEAYRISNIYYDTENDQLIIFDKYLSENVLRKVKTTNMGTMFELTYECRIKDESEQKQFIDELRVRNGNLNITMGMMPDSDGGYLN